MSMLGAALGRRVWFDQDIHHLYPMLNLLLIGPSGIGKSTSILKLGVPLIKNLPLELQPYVIEGKTTPEALHDELIVEPHSLVFASELANFFSKAKYMEDMIPYVTQLLDYEASVPRRLRGQLLEVKNPSVTLVGGSTVEWLQTQLPDSAATGGFLARFLIVKEDHKGQRVADSKGLLSKQRWEQIDQERLECYSQFTRIVGQFEGRIQYLDYGAADEYSFWYNTQQPLTGHLSPFSARAGEFVLRLAMLLALSCERERIADTDIRSAIKLYDHATAKLQSVVVPFSVAGRLVSQVLTCMGDQPRTEVFIRRAMRNIALSQEVDKVLNSLLMSQDIQRLPDRRLIRACLTNVARGGS